MNLPLLPQSPIRIDESSIAPPLRVALIEADFPIPSPVRTLLGGLDNVLLVDPSSQPCPQALIVDVGRDSRGGSALVRAMAAAFPGAPILAVVPADDSRAVTTALCSGARACLVGHTASEMLRTCLESIRTSMSGSTAVPNAMLPELSRRELDVLEGMARGWTYRQIAVGLAISPHTVHTHVRKLYEKLDARCRHDAVDAAKRLGLLKGSAGP